MTTSRYIVLAKDEGLILQSGPGRDLIFKVTGEDTGGAFDVHVFADLGRPPTPADTAYVAHLGFPALGPGASATA